MAESNIPTLDERPRTQDFVYPVVEVYLLPPKVEGPLEEPDQVSRVLVDGRAWPVQDLAWNLSGGRLPEVTIKIRARLRIMEETVEETE